jgi:phage tail tape-measure protein
MTASPQTTVAGTIAGAAAGAAGGMIAGPTGAVAGAAIGAAVGAMAGAALGANQQEQRAKDEALDRELGVIGDDTGEAQPDQPPPGVGAHSAPIDPADRPSEAPTSAEGPMPSTDPDES